MYILVSIWFPLFLGFPFHSNGQFMPENASIKTHVPRTAKKKRKIVHANEHLVDPLVDELISKGSKEPFFKLLMIKGSDQYLRLEHF